MEQQPRGRGGRRGLGAQRLSTSIVTPPGVARRSRSTGSSSLAEERDGTLSSAHVRSCTGWPAAPWVPPLRPWWASGAARSTEGDGQCWRYLSTATTRRWCSASDGQEAELGEDAAHVPFHGRDRHGERVGDRRVRSSLRHQGEHASLLGREVVQGAVGAPTTDEAGDHVTVQRRLAGRHAAHGLEEDRPVGHAFLEQVADPVGALPDQIEDVAVLEELRQDDDAHPRVELADLHRRAQPVVGAAGRHLDVGDDDVRPVVPCLSDEVDGVDGGADDGEPGALEHPDDPLAHQGLILCDHETQGRLHGRTLAVAGPPPVLEKVFRAALQADPARCRLRAMPRIPPVGALV